MERLVFDNVCFIFKNSKEASFYFKNIGAKLKKGCIIDDEKKTILVPDLDVNLFDKLLIKLRILEPDYTSYEFTSKKLAVDIPRDYQTYYFLDESADYMAQLKELII